MPLGRKKKPNSMGLMALAGETAKMAQNMMVLDKTEAALEKEMEKEEKRIEPTSKIGKARRKGEHLLHGKYLLLMVVILNVVDCLLVLGELMLDIKYVTDLLTIEYERSDEFVGSMKGLYPVELKYIDSIGRLESELLKASISWGHDSSHDTSHDAYVGNDNNTHSASENYHNTAITTTLDPNVIPTHARRRRASVTTGIHGMDTGNHSNDTGHGDAHYDDHHGHSIEEEIAHGLHKASISILGILVVETFVKIFCLGKQMFEHKLECFDSFIVIVSFIVDIVFIKGLQQFTVQEFVLILAFMVPWRIIRVVNSLVVAIMDHEHFRLVLLYKQKKKISNQLKEANGEIKGLEACISTLEKLCEEAGLPDTLVKAKLNMYRKVKAKTNAMGAISTFAVGGDAMNKAFISRPANGKVSNDIVINVEDTTTANKAGDSKPSNGDLPISPPSIAFNASIQNNHLLLERPRSRSALEVRETKSDLLKMLAENSATFIATMNKDDTGWREHLKKVKETYQAEIEDSENDGVDKPEESYGDKNDNDKEDLVKNRKNDDSDDGHDNPATQL